MSSSQSAPDSPVAPLSRGVMVLLGLAAACLALVLAPPRAVAALGLQPLRGDYEEVFSLVALALTAWASWLLCRHLAAVHGRRAFLKRAPVLWDRLTPWQRECVAECLDAQDQTRRFGASDSVVRSVCELGLLAPACDEPDDPYQARMPFVVPADVASVLHAHRSAAAPKSHLPAAPPHPSGAPSITRHIYNKP